MRRTFYKKCREAEKIVSEEFEEFLRKDQYYYNLSLAIDSDINLIAPHALEYRSFQKAAIEYCLESPNVLIADEERLGKTVTVLGLINNASIAKTLIVCTKTAQELWAKEAEKWLIDNSKIEVLSADAKLNQAQIYICNYDILPNHIALQNIKFDLIVADECHYLKDIRTRRSELFFALNSKRKLALSGTPLLNNLKDLLPIIQWLDPLWKDFAVKNRDWLVGRSGITLAFDEIQEILRSRIMVRRLHSQVSLSEPPEERIIPVTPTSDVVQFLDMELQDSNAHPKTRKILGLNKVNYAVNHLLTYSSAGEKIVAFCWHVDVLKRIGSSLGSSAVVIYGDTSEVDRSSAVERFRNDPNCKILLASISTASMSLDFSVSSHIVFVECDWSGGLMEQAKARCSAVDKGQQVIVEYIVFEKSLDYYILNKVDYKTQLSDKILD